MLDEDEAWLEEIALDMDPEDGCLAVWGTDDEIAVTAFAPTGIDNLKELVAINKQRKPTNSRK
jgi:hypothetical protein